MQATFPRLYRMQNVGVLDAALVPGGAISTASAGGLTLSISSGYSYVGSAPTSAFAAVAYQTQPLTAAGLATGRALQMTVALQAGCASATDGMCSEPPGPQGAAGLMPSGLLAALQGR